MTRLYVIFEAQLQEGTGTLISTGSALSSGFNDKRENTRTLHVHKKGTLGHLFLVIILLVIFIMLTQDAFSSM